MSRKTYFINSPDAQYNDAEFSWFQTLMMSEGIIGDPNGVIGLQVIQNTPIQDMSVLVGIGKALIQYTVSGRVFKVVTEVDAQESLIIPANSTGANRVDAIILRLDKDVVPNASKTNIATIEVVTGSGTAPLSDGAISTAVGGDSWYRLANVTVANSASAILTADIADTRVAVSATDAFNFTKGVPTGVVSEWYTDNAPAGYLFAEGQAVSRTTYANLFALWGTRFGGGDGSTTFNVLDKRGKATVGVKTINKVVVDDCEDAWDEYTASNVTSGVSTTDFKIGTKSVKIDIGSAVSANTLLCTEVISANLSAQTHLNLWMKSTVAVSAGDLQLLLDDTASCASPLEAINIPALAPNAWTRVSLPLANPSADGAIISIGLKMITDLGAFSILIDDIATGMFADIGNTDGEKLHKLTEAELASHRHGIATWNGGTSGSGTPSQYAKGYSYQTGWDRSGYEPIGGDAPHNNVQESIATRYIIKY